MKLINKGEILSDGVDDIYMILSLKNIHIKGFVILILKALKLSQLNLQVNCLVDYMII